MPAARRLRPLHRPAPPDVGSERLHREMGRWRRRSTLIRFWRAALPLVIGMIVVAVGGWVIGRTFFGPKTKPAQSRSIRMLNPRFYGRDHSGQAYVVVSDAAVRDLRNPQDVALTRPHLTLGIDRTAPPPVKLDADRGFYNETSKILRLYGAVRLDDGKGSIFNSSSAVVDTDAGEVQGPSPVSGSGPLGQITASAYAIHDKGDHIVFIGAVKTHLNNNK